MNVGGDPDRDRPAQQLRRGGRDSRSPPAGGKRVGEGCGALRRGLLSVRSGVLPCKGRVEAHLTDYA